MALQRTWHAADALSQQQIIPPSPATQRSHFMLFLVPPSANQRTAKAKVRLFPPCYPVPNMFTDLRRMGPVVQTD